jgi:hypothetical protein
MTTGLAFNARIVLQGDTYGVNHAFTHDDPDPLVEFYDTRFAHSRDPQGVMLGQFISRYRLSTLFEDGKAIRGLDLDGGIPSWTLDTQTMDDLAVNLRAMNLLPEIKAHADAGMAP